MLRIMMLVLVWAMSSWVLAEQQPADDAGKAKVELPFKILPQDEYLIKYKDEFARQQKEGVIEGNRQYFEASCMKLINIPDYCKCAAKVQNEQTDEFLFYDLAYQYGIALEIKKAMKASDGYLFQLLKLQAAARDGLNRRIAVACGVIDDATKKVVPFKAPDK